MLRPALLWSGTRAGAAGDNVFARIGAGSVLSAALSTVGGGFGHYFDETNPQNDGLQAGVFDAGRGWLNTRCQRPAVTSRGTQNCHTSEIPKAPQLVSALQLAAGRPLVRCEIAQIDSLCRAWPSAIVRWWVSSRRARTGA
jgi:hypothetical protein